MTDGPTDDELPASQPAPSTAETLEPGPSAASAPVEPLYARAADAAASDPPPNDAPTVPDVAAALPSPYVGLPTAAGSVLRQSFDLLTRAGPELRRGSFYIGLIVLGLVAPVALLAWGFEVAFPADTPYTDIVATQDTVNRATQWTLVASWLAIAGFVVAFVESRAVAMAILAARLGGRRLELRDAVQRSRRVFWRVAGGLLLINVPLGVFQYFVGNWFVDVFHGASEITALTPSIVAAIIGTPFAYVMAGIVLGDVGVIESARRSVRLFSARRRAALVVSLFALAAQLLTIVGLSAGLDILVRIFEAIGIGPTSGDLGVALTTAIIIAGIFASGTLLFTIAALSVAPQVVMFLALTHTTLGLDHIDEPPPTSEWDQPRRRKFRWLTRPMLGAMGLGALSTVAGLAALAR
ncbi:MAG: hypothetical protein ACJ77B_07915 [Chloroflexota bacterium]